jgi:hypothetical protein
MKKIISCVLVLALFLSLGLSGLWSGRAAADTPKDRVGSYVLTGLIMNGVDYTDRIRSLSPMFTLELRANGTGLLVKGDEKLELTWDESTLYAEDGIEMPYTYEDGVLVIEDDLATMTFEKGDPEDFAAPEQPDAGIVDVWVGTLDIKPSIEESAPELGALLESAPVNVSLEMREDGSYTMQLDASPILPGMRSAMYASFQKMCEENELSMEQLAESYGRSLEEVVDDTIESLALDELNQTLEGVYEMKDGEVIWDKNSEETPGQYTGDTLVRTLKRFGEVTLKRAGVCGIWSAETDLLSFLGRRDEELREQLGDCTVHLSLELRSDESFILTMDLEELLPAMRLALTSYYEKALEESGMTAEEFEERDGKTLEETVEEALADLQVDALGEPVIGRWEQEDGELSLTADSDVVETAIFKDGKLVFTRGEEELCFSPVVREDVLAKGEGVMRYEEYAVAEVDTEVCIEAYVLACQTWSEDKISVYAQDAEGGYFIYKMACSEEDAALLVPGRKIRVTGYKSLWSGEQEIIDASFELLSGSYRFLPLDLTEQLGEKSLNEYQNRMVSFKGLTVEPYDEDGAAFAYKDPENKTDDLYFKVSRNGLSFEFCVESSLCGSDSEVYKAVEALQVGDVVDLTGYLFWYEGPNPHVISLVLRERPAEQDGE